MRAASTALRVVIDTNVLVSAMIFKSGALAALRHAWQSGECVPVVSRATTEELLAVLRYPKFELDAAEQESALIAYLPYCETLPDPKTRVKLPRCRDEDDQIFLLLAVASKVDALITGDKDLLALRGAAPCEILTPVAFLARSSPKR
jgi:putative PIN family toxin of toxin-antitoxin system